MSGFNTPPTLGRWQASSGYVQKSVTATIRSCKPNSNSISVIEGEVEIILLGCCSNKLLASKEEKNPEARKRRQ